MTPEQMRIAIAEKCGFVEIYLRSVDNCYYGWNKSICEGATLELPNYPYDLNAMHSAEKCLEKNHDSSGSLYDYRKHLEAICGSMLDATTAEAFQRAEAFCRATGIWKD